jgi:integrase
MVTDTDGRDDNIPAVADGSAAPGPVLTLAQAADRLHLRPSLLRRLMRHGTLLPDERDADGQPRFRAATLDLYAAQRSIARSTLGPTLRRQFARVLKQPGQARSNWRLQHYVRMITKAGLPYIRPHNLRHTAATLLLLEGVQPHVVSNMLGHSSVAFTLTTFGHVLNEMRKPARDAMERLFGGVFG